MGNKYEYGSSSVISITNNENFDFDLSSYTPTFNEEEQKIFDNSQLFDNKSQTIYKIMIDFKDGSKQTISKPFKSLTTNNDWLKFSHIFKFKDEKFFNAGFTDELEIKIYNLIKDEPELLKISFTVETGGNAEIDLISANLTNDKKISYVFKTKDKNQIILGKYDKINS